MRENWEFLPPYFVTSATKKQEKEEVLDFIEDNNKMYLKEKNA